jgi:hypothetical protein
LSTDGIADGDQFVCTPAAMIIVINVRGDLVTAKLLGHRSGASCTG